MDHLGNLGKEALTIVAIPLGTNNLPGLVSNLASNAINTFERKISGQRAVKARKELTLFISNGDMNVFIKIIKSLEDLGLLIDGVIDFRIKYVLL